MGGNWQRLGVASVLVGLVAFLVGGAACSSASTCDPLVVRQSDGKRVASNVVCTYLEARSARPGTAWFYGGCADLCGGPAVRCHVDCAFQSAFAVVPLGGDGGAHTCPAADVSVVCQQTTGSPNCSGASAGSGETMFPSEPTCESAER
jgi:hypothetical protein